MPASITRFIPLTTSPSSSQLTLMLALVNPSQPLAIQIPAPTHTLFEPTLKAWKKRMEGEEGPVVFQHHHHLLCLVPWQGVGNNGDEPSPLHPSNAPFCNALAKGWLALTSWMQGGTPLQVVLPPLVENQLAYASQCLVEALRMAAYRYDEWRSNTIGPPEEVEVQLALAAPITPGQLKAIEGGIAAGEAVAGGITLTRNVVNAPANQANTRFMVQRAEQLASEIGATFEVIEGDALKAQGYHLLWAVGRAAEHPSALVRMVWQGPSQTTSNQITPHVALVGKGVVFDSGGLDIKPSSAMVMMKKDMGGSGIVLGALRAIAKRQLPLKVSVVLAFAENAIGPNAMRPGDVYISKQGLSVEITNTDAEGRLVLADAFQWALETKPDWLIDFATLTGACRVALGKEVMGMFCNQNSLRDSLMQAANEVGEGIWPLPLWPGYDNRLDSGVADLRNSVVEDGFAGAITAALFLQRFCSQTPWAHLDCYAWSDGNRPLFPKGAEGAGVRMLERLAWQLAKKR